MTWLVLVLAGWLLCSIAVAVVIGLGIRLADRRQSSPRAGATVIPLVRPAQPCQLAMQAASQRAS